MEDNNIIKEKVISKISIYKFKEENIAIKKPKNYKYMKYGMVACICLMFSTGIVFSKEIESYIKKIFNNSTKAIDVAVENGYIQEENVDYIYDKDIGIKVDNLIVDDLNLDIAFNFETKNENVKSIRLKDFVITNDNEKVVFQSGFKGVEKLEEIPIYNSVTWANEPIKLTDTTFRDSILFGLRPESEEFKELYFDIKSLDLVYENGTQETIDGDWKLMVSIDEKMRVNTNIIYTLLEENKYVENAVATLSPTGVNIKLTLKESFDAAQYIMDNLDILNDIAVFYLKYNNELISPSNTEVSNNLMNEYILRFDSVSIFDELNEIELYLIPFDSSITLIKND